MSVAYYNEIDPGAAAWLRQLIARDLIAPGMVDERSIEDVSPADLGGYTQCPFFAGIGCWSYALRLGDWPDGRPVWTASLPCQPFSAAGARGGFADERHLWPVFLHLLNHAKPRSVPVLGEQVANRGGLEWFDLVSIDLEGEGYAVGAVDTCAAGFGAPHIRQRLYWVADAGSVGRERRRSGEAGGRGSFAAAERRGDAGGLADADSERYGRATAARHETRPDAGSGDGGDAGDRPGPVNGRWADADWLLCRDSKWRPVEPGTFPLASGAPARVGRLRGYGNSLCVPQATAFVKACAEVLTS